MSDIFQTSIPPWLENIARPIDTKLTGQVIGSVIAGGLMAKDRAEQPESEGWLSEFLPAAHEARLNLIDPMWKLKAQQAQLGIMSNALGIVGQQQAIDANKTKMALQAKDLEEVPKWLQDHPTVESRMNAEWPSAMTPEWNRNLDQLRLRDSQSVQAKTIVSGVKSFADRVAALGKEDATAAAQIAGAARQYTQRGQMPPPEIVQSLSLAEEAAAQRRENARQAAITAAEVAGQVPETRITDKGVQTIYKPSSAPKAATAITPQEMTLTNGTRIVYNPHTGAFKLVPVKGKEETFTAPQLLAIANARPTKDAQAIAIKKFLSDKAMGQITNAPAATTTAPAAPVPTRVRRKSDGAEFIYRGNASDVPKDSYDVLP